MSDNKVRRTEDAAGRGTYSFTADEETENMIATAAAFHRCGKESIVALAISIYVSSFEDAVELAVAARDSGPRH